MRGEISLKYPIEIKRVCYVCYKGFQAGSWLDVDPSSVVKREDIEGKGKGKVKGREGEGETSKRHEAERDGGDYQNSNVEKWIKK